MPNIDRVTTEHNEDGVTIQVYLDTGDIIDLSLMVLAEVNVGITTTLDTISTGVFRNASRCTGCNEILIDNTCYTNLCSQAPTEDN